MYTHTQTYIYIHNTVHLQHGPLFEESRSQGPEPKQRASRHRPAVQVQVHPFRNFRDIIANFGKSWDFATFVRFEGTGKQTR